MTAFSRRTLLVSGGAALLVAACGSSKKSSSSGATSTSSATGGDVENGATGGLDLSKLKPGEIKVISFFQAGISSPEVPARFPFGLGDKDGIFENRSGAPDSLVVQIKQDNKVVIDKLVVARHDQGLKRPYYPVIAQLGQGIYDLTFATADGKQLDTATVSIAPPEAIVVKRPTQPMPKLVTPTTKDPKGVNPICTRDPVCPLHDVTLADAIDAKKPVALLVGTPQFCQTGICGPVLDVLLDTKDAYAGKVTFLHAEVYTDDTAQTPTEAVNNLGLTFEPSLFLVGADGIIKDRIDTIYDKTELKAALDKLIA